MLHSDKFSLTYILKASALILCTALLAATASAATYSAYPGSAVIIKSVSGRMMGISSNKIETITTAADARRPLLGGLVRGIGDSCLTNNEVTTIEGWKGVRVADTNLLLGLTGTILNGVAHYILPNTTERIGITGGLSFNSFGVATGVGDVPQYEADTLCGTVKLPVGTQLNTGGNAAWGNEYADLDLKVWLYVPADTKPGIYTLDSISIAQGPSGSNSPNQNSHRFLAYSGETIQVLPAPCTISTQSSIVFDTTTEAGMKVSAPVTYHCGDLSTPSNLDAFLQIKPLGNTSSATEMNLTINGSQPGGVVRGYAGQGLESSNVNCQDNTYSLSFQEAYAAKIGSLISNTHQETPLIWQLCRKGNEVAGLATGSAILSINYK